MDIDYIVLANAKENIPEVNETRFDKMAHECKLFINSFRSDSSALGNVYDSDDPDVLDVWITAGRDQSTILKNMVDQMFTPETGIKVNVKLIDAAASANTATSANGAVNAMLPAVISGFGPDVALCISQTEPVNYALRSAVVDLSAIWAVKWMMFFLNIIQVRMSLTNLTVVFTDCLRHRTTTYCSTVQILWKNSELMRKKM